VIALSAPLTAARSQTSIPNMSAPTAQDRVLVIAPHPDDESLCCAGILQRAHANGASTAIVWITAGDGFELDAALVERSLWPKQKQLRQLGEQRLHEAQRAADELSVPRSGQYLLGYPDRGVAALMSDYYARTYRSKYTGLSAVDYPGALSPEAAYTGSNLQADLDRVIAQFQPTLVLAAAPQDAHPDHSSSGELVRRLMIRRGELSRLRYWIVHAPHWPRPFGTQSQVSLLPPASAAALQWQSLPLSGSERAHKLVALRDHHSQMELTAPLMLSFVRANEIFALPGDAPDSTSGHH
jgi:LmbE family N-acetylglucosaminyl deacetylase